MDDLFCDNEVCDGRYCRDKKTCARWMMRCDIDRCYPFVICNIKPWPSRCPYYLKAPDKRYPEHDNIKDFKTRKTKQPTTK